MRGCRAGRLERRHAPWHPQVLEGYRIHYRKQASTHLSKKYQGVPCRRCAGTLRYVGTRACVACRKVAATTWQEANPERKKALEAAWRAANPERDKAVRTAWRIANPEKRSASHARRRAAQLQRTPAWADLRAIEAVYSIRGQLERAHGVPLDVDHVVPLQGKNVSGLHVEYNLQIIPKTLNMKKKNRFTDDAINYHQSEFTHES
jgi:hypothetical protein